MERRYCFEDIDNFVVVNVLCQFILNVQNCDATVGWGGAGRYHRLRRPLLAVVSSVTDWQYAISTDTLPVDRLVG